MRNTFRLTDLHVCTHRNPIKTQVRSCYTQRTCKTKEKILKNYYGNNNLWGCYWVCLVLAIYCWTWVLPLRVVCFSLVSFSWTKKYLQMDQWNQFSGLGWGQLSTFALITRSSIWLNLCLPHACYHSVCEFICALLYYA